MPSFKILGASWAVYRLLVARLAPSPRWDTLDDLRAAFAPLGALELVAATDGNHGRAVAHMATPPRLSLPHPRSRRHRGGAQSTGSRARARR